MKAKQLLILVFSVMTVFSCGKDDNTDLFYNSQAVDLNEILQAYDWYQHSEDEDKEKLLLQKIASGMPNNDEFWLFDDTSFVIHVPEYANSKQPFLANAEDFYNGCVYAWNFWSNQEIWYRGHTADLLREDEDVKSSIRGISTDFIRDQDVRKAANHARDSMLIVMNTNPKEWDEEFDPMGIIINFANVIESKAYKFYDDEEAFIDSLDSINSMAESMAKHKFKHYLDADEEHQLATMLGELATCRNFDEQCSLWCLWANCKESTLEDEWLVAVGCRLMDSGYYNPLLNRIWITWRALCQTMYFGMSRDSAIPNHYYNEYRRKCYLTCLKRIERHPDDVFAMNCAAAIGGRVNLNRFGQNYFGNEAMIEEAMMMPNRYHTGDENDDESDEE